MYIKNKLNRSSIKACSPFKLSCNLKVLHFEIAYFSYTHRYGQFDKETENVKNQRLNISQINKLFKR